MIHKFRRLRISSGLNFSSNLRSGVKKIAWSPVTSVEALWCLGRTCPGENYTQTYTDLLLLRPRIKDRLLSTRVTLCNILLYTSATGKFLRGWFETFCRCNFAMLSKFALLNFVPYSIIRLPLGESFHVSVKEDSRALYWSPQIKSPCIVTQHRQHPVCTVWYAP